MNQLPELRAGDCLLYYMHDFFDEIIALKTWNRVAHVEVYIGNGASVASRNGLGVAKYPLRVLDIAYVRRPHGDFRLYDALEWFTDVDGQGYDWLGLLCFTLALKQGSPDKMFCSEFATNFYRHGCIDIVANDYPADLVAPAQLLQSPSLTTIWRSS